MKSLLNYSAVTAKVKAMKSRFLTEEQFKELAFLPDVPSAVEYLRNFSAYREIFEDYQGQDLHRGDIEKLLNLSLYRDFASLYRFSGISQRRFLDLYFMHFEIDILKKCLRNAMSSRKSELDLSIFGNFFKRHSRLDLVGLSEAASLPEFVEGLKGSYFYEPMKALAETGTASLFDCESAMDRLYFVRLWRNLKHELDASEQDAVRTCIGEKIDLLNLEWIGRAAKNYTLPPEVLRSFLIPVHCWITEAELLKMAAAGNEAELRELLAATRYRNRLFRAEETAGNASGSRLKPFYRRLLDSVYKSSGQKNPYSAAILNTYFYFKEEEIRKIITAIEGIRYQLGGNEILSCLAES